MMCVFGHSFEFALFVHREQAYPFILKTSFVMSSAGLQFGIKRMTVRNKDMGMIKTPSLVFFFRFCEYLNISDTMSLIPPNEISNFNR